jgi:hypothetical protein
VPKKRPPPSPHEPNLNSRATIPPLPELEDRGDELDPATKGWVYRQNDKLSQQIAQKIAERDEMREAESRRRNEDVMARIEALVTRAELTVHHANNNMDLLRGDAQGFRQSVSMQATSLSQILERMSRIEQAQSALRKADDSLRKADEALSKEIASLKIALERHSAALEDNGNGGGR